MPSAALIWWQTDRSLRRQIKKPLVTIPVPRGSGFGCDLSRAKATALQRHFMEYDPLRRYLAQERIVHRQPTAHFSGRAHNQVHRKAPRARQPDASGDPGRRSPVRHDHHQIHAGIARWTSRGVRAEENDPRRVEASHNRLNEGPDFSARDHESSLPQYGAERECVRDIHPSGRLRESHDLRRRQARLSIGDSGGV